MPHTDFWICGVCGAEIAPHTPCYIALEVIEASVYLASSQLWDAHKDFVCPACLPLKRYKPINPKVREVKKRLFNRIIASLTGQL